MNNVEPPQQPIESSILQKDKSTNKYDKKYFKKELIFDEEKNKYFLFDKKNGKLNKANLFGKITSHINIPQVGKATYAERISSKTLKELNFNIDNTLYRPISNHFDGYTQFPRPLTRPFSNAKNIHNKKMFINNITNNEYLLNILKNKKLFTGNNDKINSKLNYYTCQLSNIINYDNRNSVLKIIDNALNNKKSKLNDKEKKKLILFKKKIINNSLNLINGIKFPKPKSKFYNKFEINYNVMFQNPLNNCNLFQKDSKINVKIYDILYKSINNNSLTILKNNENSNIENKNIEYYNNLIEKNKDFNSEENKRYFYQENTSFNSSMFDTTSKDNKNNKIIQRVNSDLSFPELQGFKSLELIRNKSLETIEQFDSVINSSNINLKQKNNFNSNKNISFIVNLKKKYNMEKKLLCGYIRPVSKDSGFYRKPHPNFKSTADIYKKELDLLSIVNPKILKIEEEKNMKQENYLKRHLQMNLLEKNSKNNKNNKNNKRQLSANSALSRISKK